MTTWQSLVMGALLLWAACSMIVDLILLPVRNRRVQREEFDILRNQVRRVEKKVEAIEAANRAARNEPRSNVLTLDRSALRPDVAAQAS